MALFRRNKVRENPRRLFKPKPLRIGWNFLKCVGGVIHGLGNAGIETFKGAPIDSLAREICQNSLDACRDPDKPVKVEFSLGYLQKEQKEKLSLSDIKKYLEECIFFWKDQEPKTEAFLEKALKEINKRKLPFLRISDFNTTGLEGSDQKFNTPWSNLVRSTGISNKRGDSGGSFGIGKSAAFNNSKLRTIIYTTKDRNGREATQGVAQLISYQEDKDGSTICFTGEGFFGLMDDNDAIPRWLSFDPDFFRIEPGTDLYILEPDLTKNWADQIRIAIIKEFLLSIYLGKLEVVVDGEEIKKENLEEYVNRYKTKLKGTYDYYMVLESDDTRTFEIQFKDLGKFKLQVLYEQDLNRKVLMCRKNGMKIFEIKRFPKLCMFSAVCYLEDSEINNFFKEIENPQHNSWEPERAEDPKRAKQYCTEFQRLVRNTIIDQNKTIKVDEVDAKGVGEFLPDNQEDIVDTKEKVSQIKQEEDESQQEEDEGYEIEEIKYNPKHLKLKNEIDESSFVEVQKRTEKTKKKKEGKKHVKRTQLSIIDFMDLINDHKKIEDRDLRLISLKNERYRLIFQIAEDYDNVYLELKYSGEQKKMNAQIKEAWNPVTKESFKIKGNKIFLGQTGSEKTVLEFKTKKDYDCPMEISLYGFK